VYNLLYDITFFLFNTVAKLFWTPVDIRGLDNLQNIQGPLILAANHRERIDAIWIWYYIGLVNKQQTKQLAIRFVTWHAFFSMPVLGWYLKQMRCYPIINKQGLGVLDDLVKYLQEGSIAGIFPDGRMHKIAKPPLKAGRGVAYLMQKTQAPVIPVYLEYRRRWKNWPFFTFSMIVGEQFKYGIIKEEELQKVAYHVLEKIYQLGEAV